MIDNASPDQAAVAQRARDQGARFHGLRHNLGLARAQNIGARCAWRAGMDAVLLMDQDSVAAPDMVGLLSAPHRVTTGALAAGPLAASPRLACTAPLPVDARTGTPMRLLRSADRADLPHGLVPCDFVIASGMLIPRHAWRSIGPMRDELFIDHVDTEWCLRARAAGGLLAAVPRARLAHRLGSDGRRVWLGRWRYFPHHSPLRHYYMLRNSLALRRLAHVTPSMGLWLVLRAYALVLLSLILLPQRRRRWSALVRAVRDARCGRAGMAPDAF